MLVVLFVSTLGQFALVANASRVDIQYNLICAQLETDLVNLQDKTVCLLAFPCPPFEHHIAFMGAKAEPAFFRKNKRSTLPSTNELWLDTTGVANDNDLESVEYKLQGSWLVAVPEVTNF
ncbi:hypothetical protein TNCV_3442991 [Trichonephila clavipes]|nr:hypothetical protein TNCV_3442991 [Trichonephila clavipes]